jgi:uncharacterized Zn finger protein
VQGSRAQPYAVRIILPPFSELVWARAEIALSEQALPAAKLLAGEVPPELEEIFAAAGAPLFPTTVEDLDQHCSCPDWEVPCKHLAATFYLMAEAFDADPFLILRWRGRDREELLARLRQLRGDHGAGVMAPTEAPRPGAAGVLADLTWPDPAPDRFWQPPTPLPPRPTTLDVEPGIMLRQLPEPPAILGGALLTASLTEVYRRFGESAQDDHER